MDRDRASRLIGLLLRLYPKDFRRRFGHGMQADLEDRYLEAAGAPDRSGLKWFWLRTAWDAFRLASVEHYEAVKRSTHRLPSSPSSPARSIPRMAAPLEHVIHDIRYATRLLVKDPFVSGIAVLTFGLGIALFATTFSIVYGSTWRGLPFEDPDALVHFERANPSQGISFLAVTPHDYMEWKEQQRSFEGLAAFVEAYINLAGGAGPPEPQTGVYIDSEAFGLLRVQPLLGRIFGPAEHAVDGPRAILLSHGLWQSRYGGDSSIVGRTIRATEEVSAEYSVVGVMPEGFGFPIAERFWLPLRLDMNRIERGKGRLDVFGRLKNDVTFEQMETEFAAISLRLEREFPQTNTGIVAGPATFHEEYIGAEFTNRVRAMLAGSILVLVIACINVTNLLLVRITRRRKEIAVRTALGAGRGRVVSMVLTETTLLAAIGTALGITAAFYGTQRFGAALVNSGALRLPHGGDSLFWWEFKVDTVPILTAIAAAAICAALAGLIPAIHAAGARVSDVLKEESGKMSPSGFRRFGNALVTVEIALTMGLLVATALTVKSVLKLRNADYAFESDRVLTARVGLWGERYSGDAAARAQFWIALQERLDAIPGVESATLMSRAPMMPARPTPVAIGGEIYANAGDIPFARYLIISPTYFEVYGVSVLEGRGFDGRDVSGGVPVAIVNQSFARRFFPDREVLGGRFRTGRDGTGPLLTVVGVVPDLWMDGERNRDREGFYVPLAQRRPADLMVAARTRGDPAALAPSLREALAGLDPDQPIYEIRSMSEVVDERTGRFRIYGSFYIAFGVAALFLALVGLYGVVSFTVSQQTREIGVRIALGANQNDVVWSVLKFGALHVMWGVVAGVGMAFWISRGLASVLFQVEAWDAPTVAGVALVLIFTSLAACAFPALRASRIAPVIAMRHE